MAISLGETIYEGLSDFWSRKLRSFLTILGILLGTMSIIVVLALVKATNEQTIAWMMARGGLDLIRVRRNWDYESDKQVKRYLEYSELRMIQELLPEMKYFSPTRNDHGQIKYGKNEIFGRFVGATPDYRNMEEWGVGEGRFLKEIDMKQMSDVIVIGTNVRDELFGNREPIGQWIVVEGHPMKVIGVLEHRYFKSTGGIGGENAMDWMNWFSFIPLSTMLKKMTGRSDISGFKAKAASPEQAGPLKKKLEAMLLNMRAGEDVFQVTWNEEEAAKMQEQSWIFHVIFLTVSTISLLVGGIVITNIMLATIQERTREIGVRLAVGARRMDIFLQFLVQTVLIAMIGGIAGVVVGFSILDWIGSFMEMELQPALEMIYVALAVSMGIGLVFGITPAIRASNLDPVKALRYE